MPQLPQQWLYWNIQLNIDYIKYWYSTTTQTVQSDYFNHYNSSFHQNNNYAGLHGKMRK